MFNENVVNYFLGIQVRSRPFFGKGKKFHLCDFGTIWWWHFGFFVQLQSFFFLFWCPRNHGKNTCPSRDRVGPQLTCRCQQGWICEWLPLRIIFWQVCSPWKRMAKGRWFKLPFLGVVWKGLFSGAKRAASFRECKITMWWWSCDTWKILSIAFQELVAVSFVAERKPLSVQGGYDRSQPSYFTPINGEKSMVVTWAHLVNIIGDIHMIKVN